MVKENKELLARLNLGAFPRFLWLGASLSRGIHCMCACVRLRVHVCMRRYVGEKVGVRSSRGSSEGSSVAPPC